MAILTRGDGMARPRLSAASAEMVKTAGRAARKMGHSFVGTEHLLLAFLQGGQSAAAKILGWMGWDCGIWQDVLLCHRGRGDGNCPLVQGFSSGAGRAILAAQREAQCLLAEKVEPEHILLAMSRDENCTAVRLMRQFGNDMNLLFSDLYNSLQRDLQTEKERYGSLKLTEQFCEDMVARAAGMTSWYMLRP